VGSTWNRPGKRQAFVIVVAVNITISATITAVTSMQSKRQEKE
jgi:hypothetical protein